MVKVFTTNKNGKIELTEQELKTLLDEVYWEGYRDNSHSWTYSTPKSYPYWYSTSTPLTNLTSKDITISTSKDSVSNGTTSALNGTTSITFDTSNMANSVYVGKD